MRVTWLWRAAETSIERVPQDSSSCSLNLTQTCSSKSVKLLDAISQCILHHVRILPSSAPSKKMRVTRNYRSTSQEHRRTPGRHSMLTCLWLSVRIKAKTSKGLSCRAFPSSQVTASDNWGKKARQKAKNWSCRRNRSLTESLTCPRFKCSIRWVPNRLWKWSLTLPRKRRNKLACNLSRRRVMKAQRMTPAILL